MIISINKKLFVFTLILFFLIGCAETEDPVEKQEPLEQIIEEEEIIKTEDIEEDKIVEKEELQIKEEMITDEPVVLTEHLFELEKTEYIVPLGELQGGWEEREVNNMALVQIKRPGGHNSISEIMKIYAPTKISLISYSYYSYGDYSPTWTLIFEVNSDKTLKLSALTDVSDKIKNLVGNDFTKGELNLQTPIKLEPGELIGQSGGTSDVHNWDVLFYDKKHTNQFVNQQRYEKDYMGERYRTARCFFELYPEEMQQEYVKLFGFNAPGLTKDCGSASRDVAGTLSGAWFLSKQGFDREERGMFTSPLFIYSNSAGGTSLGYVNKKRYSISKDNPTNKDPSDVRDEHCYNLINIWDNSADGYAYFNIISNTEMHLASGASGKCPSTFPKEFETYYR